MLYEVITDKSAEETIKFSTSPANAANTAEPAARVAELAFCEILLKSNSGVSFEKNFSNRITSYNVCYTKLLRITLAFSEVLHGTEVV